MKKLLILALSALLVLGLASVSLAAATFSGEIDVAYKGQTYDATSHVGSQTDYSLGKMVLTGKLGDDLTGTLVFLSDPVTTIAVDEADVTFTEDWGSLKLGYYGWNNNVKDIVSAYRDDVKSKTNISTSFAFTDNVKLGLAYAVRPTGADGLYGADLGIAGDNFGLDLIYTNTLAGSYAAGSDPVTGIGVNAFVKLDAFKPYVQYENYQGNNIDTIVGFTFDPADNPVYARAEVNLTTYNSVTEWGIRLGYKLSDGAKLETQYNISAALNGTVLAAAGTTNANWYVKVIAAF